MPEGNLRRKLLRLASSLPTGTEQRRNLLRFLASQMRQAAASDFATWVFNSTGGDPMDQASVE